MCIDVLTDISWYVVIKLLSVNGKLIFINNLTNNPNYIVKFIKPLLKYIIFIDFGRILEKKDFIDLAKNLDKKVNFELIDSMTIINVFKYFKIYFIYWILNKFGLKNYDIEQYSIIID